jgi:hypothetical protein
VQVRRILVWDQPRQKKSSRNPISTNKSCGSIYLSSQLHEEAQIGELCSRPA